MPDRGGICVTFTVQRDVPRRREARRPAAAQAIGACPAHRNEACAGEYAACLSQVADKIGLTLGRPAIVAAAHGDRMKGWNAAAARLARRRRGPVFHMPHASRACRCRKGVYGAMLELPRADSSQRGLILSGQL